MFCEKIAQGNGIGKVDGGTEGVDQQCPFVFIIEDDDVRLFQGSAGRPHTEPQSPERQNTAKAKNIPVSRKPTNPIGKEQLRDSIWVSTSKVLRLKRT